MNIFQQKQYEELKKKKDSGQKVVLDAPKKMSEASQKAYEKTASRIEKASGGRVQSASSAKKSIYSDSDRYIKTQREKKWYKGATPTAVETLARIAQVAQTDRASAEKAYGIYNQQSQKGGIFYEPYAQATSSYATALGVDPSLINDEWVAGISPYLEAGVHTSTGALSTAKKNGADAVMAANINGLIKDYNDTKELLAEEALAKQEAQYWMSKGLSDDEIKAKLNIGGEGSKYTGLTNAINKAKIGEVTPTTAPIMLATSYGIDGMLWGLRNPNQSKGDYKLDAVQAQLGRGGKATAPTADEIARRTPGNAAWSPYTNGTTMDEEGILFGRTEFDQAWLDENRERILSSGTEAEKKAFANLWEAEQRTQAVEAALADFNATVQLMLESDSTPDEIFSRLSDFPQLVALQEGVQKGAPVGLTRSVDFDYAALQKRVTDEYNLKQAQKNAPKDAAAMNTAVEAEKQAVIAANGSLIEPETTPQSKTKSGGGLFVASAGNVIRDGVLWAGAAVTSGVKATQEKYVADQPATPDSAPYRLAGAYAEWSDDQKDAAFNYISDSKGGFDTTDAVQEMRDAGLTDEEINTFRSQMSEALGSGDYTDELMDAWFEPVEEAAPEAMPEEPAAPAEAEAPTQPEDDLSAFFETPEEAELYVRQQETIQAVNEAVDEGDYRAAAELQYNLIADLLANSDDAYAQELVHSEGSQKAAATLMTFVMEAGLPNQLDDPDIRAQLRVFEEYAVEAFGIDQEPMTEFITKLDGLLGMNGALVNAQQNEGIGLQSTLMLIWDTAMAKGADFANNLIGQALMTVGGVLGNEGMVTAGEKTANELDDRLAHYDAVVKENGTPLEILGAQFGSEMIHMQQMGTLAQGMMNFSKAKFGETFKFLTRMVGASPFAAEAGTSEFHETYAETGDLLLSSATSLASTAVTALMSQWDGILKNIEANGMPFIPELVEKLGTVPGSGAMAGAARWGKAFSMWLGNLGKTAINEAIQEPAENIATTFLTDLIRGKNPFDKDWDTYGKELIAEGVGAAIISLGSSVSTMPTYARSVKVAESQMGNSVLTAEDINAFAEALKEDMADPVVVEEAQKRANNIAVEALTGEMIASGALGEIDTSKVEAAQEKVEEAQTALAEADAAVEEANARLNENITDPALANEVVAASAARKEARKRERAALLELEKAQAEQKAQTEAQMAAVREQAAAEVETRKQEIRKFNYSDVNTEANTEAVSGMEPVATLSGDEFTFGDKNLTKDVAAYFEQEYGGMVQNPVLGDVLLSKRGAKDSLGHGMTPQKAVAYAAVPEVIQNGQIIDIQRNWRQKQLDTFAIAAPITIERGEKAGDYYMAVVVQRTSSADGQRFYVHDVILQENKKTGPEASFEPEGVTEPLPATEEVTSGDAKDPTLQSLLEKVRGVKDKKTESKTTPTVFDEGDTTPDDEIAVIEETIAALKENRAAAQSAVEAFANSHAQDEESPFNNVFVSKEDQARYDELQSIVYSIEAQISKQGHLRDLEYAKRGDADAARRLSVQERNQIRPELAGLWAEYEQVASVERGLRNKKDFQGIWLSTYEYRRMEEAAKEAKRLEQEYFDAWSKPFERGEQKTTPSESVQPNNEPAQPLDSSRTQVPQQTPQTNTSPATGQPSNLAVSQFATQTGQNTTVLSDGVKKELRESPYYQKTSQKGNVDLAINNIETEGYETRRNKLLDGTTNLYTPEGQAEAYVLAKAAKERGDTTDESSIAFKVKESGTLLGQSMAMRRMYIEMTPEGKVQFIQRIVDQINQGYANRGKSTRVEVPAWLQERLDKAGGDDAKVAKVIDDAYAFIAGQMPPDWRSRVDAWRYTSMLANPRTHARNILGNLFFMPAVAIKNKIGALAELALPADQRTKSLAPVKQEYKVFAKTQLDAVREVLTGGGKYNPMDEIQAKRRTFNSPVLEWVTTKNGAALKAEDTFFLNQHFTNALAGFLQARGANLNNVDRNVLQEGLDYAIAEAQKATYRDASEIADKLSKFTRDLSNSKKRSAKAFGLLIEGALPFKKTPINVMRRGIEYSPVGLLHTLTVGMHDMKKGDLTKGDLTKADFIDRLASGLTGTGLAVVGWWLSSLGLLKLKLDEPEEKLEELTGAQEYSIELFGKSITIDWLSPSAMPLFVGGAIQELPQQERGEFNLNTMTDALLGIAEPVFNLSMLDGVNSLLSSASYSENGVAGVLSNAAESYASQFVPSVLGAFARLADPVRRTTYTDKTSGVPSSIQYLIDSTINKIPGLSRTGQPYLNAWGEEDVTSSGFHRLIENFVSPGYVNNMSADEVETALMELFDLTHDEALLPKAPSKYFTVNKTRKDLTGEEYENLTRERGQTAKKLHEELFGSPEFTALPAKYQVSALQSVWDYSTQMAKQMIAPEFKLDSWVANAKDPAGAILEKTTAQMKKDRADAMKLDLYSAIDSGDAETAATYVEGIIEGGTERKSLRTSLTNQYKKVYRDLYEEGDVEGMRELESTLLILNVGYKLRDIQKWLDKE